MDYLYKMNPKVYESIEFDYDVAIFSLSGFSREILPLMKANNIPIVCDMQTIDNLTNDYGSDFMSHSEVIFFSDDHFNGDIELLVKELYKKYNYKVIGVGMGSKGCILCIKGRIKYYKAYESKVVNTVGAGDTLFTSFIHFYYNGDSEDVAINKALLYVSKKIEHRTASEGFMSLKEFEEIYLME